MCDRVWLQMTTVMCTDDYWWVTSLEQLGECHVDPRAKHSIDPIDFMVEKGWIGAALIPWRRMRLAIIWLRHSGTGDFFRVSWKMPWQLNMEPLKNQGFKGCPFFQDVRSLRFFCAWYSWILEFLKIEFWFSMALWNGILWCRLSWRIGEFFVPNMAWRKDFARSFRSYTAWRGNSTPGQWYFRFFVAFQLLFWRESLRWAKVSWRSIQLVQSWIHWCPEEVAHSALKCWQHNGYGALAACSTGKRYWGDTHRSHLFQLFPVKFIIFLGCFHVHTTYLSEAGRFLDSFSMFLPFVFQSCAQRLNAFSTSAVFDSFRVAGFSTSWCSHILYITRGCEHVPKVRRTQRTQRTHESSRIFLHDWKLRESCVVLMLLILNFMTGIERSNDRSPWLSPWWFAQLPAPGGTDPTPAPVVKSGEFGCSDGQQPLHLFQFRLWVCTLCQILHKMYLGLPLDVVEIAEPVSRMCWSISLWLILLLIHWFPQAKRGVLQTCNMQLFLSCCLHVWSPPM